MSHLPVFEYHQPQTLDAALTLFAAHGPSARALAGGTELLPKLRAGRPAPAHLVSLNRIAALRELTFSTEAGLSIGAGVRIRDLADHPQIQKYFPALTRACTEMATVQIRNMATVAGNLVNGSPCADTAGPLLIHDATVHLASKKGARTIALADFFEGPGQVARAPDEVLTRITLPAPPALPTRSGEAFGRLSARSRVDIAAASASARLLQDAEGKVSFCRIALGAVAPTPLRCPDAEALLVGQRPEDARLREAAEAAGRACRPISDLRATADYRRAVVPVLVRRALEESRRAIDAQESA